MLTKQSSEPIIVVGGGWAGIAATLHLAAQGHAVELLEAAPVLGGRARRVLFGQQALDNGQHIILGAYRHLFELLDIIGLDERRVLLRQPLALQMINGCSRFQLQVSKLPAPWHLGGALLTANGLSAGDKIKTLMHGLGLSKQPHDLTMTVSQWLHQLRQPPAANRYLWEPLCIAALNTHPHIASAQLFQRVLSDVFMQKPAYSDLLLPRCDMGRLLAQPAQQWLSQQAVAIRLSLKVNRLIVDGGQIVGVLTPRGRIAAKKIVLATNPWTTAKLIASFAQLSTLHERLEQFRYEPIATIYLKYAHSLSLTPIMSGLIGCTTQWLFDRRITGHPHIAAAVISASGEHTRLAKSALVQQVIDDIKQAGLLSSDPIDTLVIREKRATFSATPAMDVLRPDNVTSIGGLVLAGDYTATGYPATLEGALMSGKQAASIIAKA